MRLSRSPFSTRKTVKSELASKNAKLLTQAGYIHQEIAGVYSFLPLGLRVLTKIENIIREEMNTVSQEIFMTALQPQENWARTHRLDTVDVLMKTSPANPAALAKNDSSYVLGSTHEEIVTPLVQEFAQSYRQLPKTVKGENGEMESLSLCVYQLQTKFRNEPRAKSGLLRCREFRMKDAYSFHQTEADLKAYYEVMKQAYFRIFERLGIGADTKIALASGGDFTPDFSHEFQTICDAGEDTLFWAKSADIVYNREVAPSKAPKWNNTNEPLEEKIDVEGEGVIGVNALAKFLKIPVEKTTKTMLYETDKGELVAVAVRGNYQIHEEKVCKILHCNRIALASPETVKRVTGAEVGYAGPLHLPAEVTVLWDESTKGRRNFECGANRTHYHSLNVNFGRDVEEPKTFYDVKIAEEGDLYPKTNEPYEVVRACEVGNIFPLNTKFSKAFDFTFTAEDGTARPVYMGCYGIGSSRLLGVVTEKYADEKGLVWPQQIAPFTVHLIDITMPERGKEIYEALQSMGIEVLWDDRDVRAGEKFADADLLGIPVRLVVSAKTAEHIEWKERVNGTPELISLGEVINRANALQKNN